MNMNAPIPTIRVPGYRGEILVYTPHDLPAGFKRWNPARKLLVVKAVRTFTGCRAAILERYKVSEEEFTAWEQAYDRAGLYGLKAGLSREEKTK